MTIEDERRERVKRFVAAVREAVLSAAGPQSDGRVTRPATLRLGEALKAYDLDVNSCRAHDDCG